MISVTIVTWNSAQYLDECFASIEQQDYRDLEVIIVDNASTDNTRERLRQVETRWQVIYNERNVGFAAGQNQAIRAACGDWVLCLNPDVVLSPDFVTRLVAAGKAHPEAGSICGKLLRWDPSASGDSMSPQSALKGRDFQPCHPVSQMTPLGAEGELPQRLKPDFPPTLDGTPEGAPLQDPRRTNIIDSTGIYFTRNMRHLDRGAEETDRGQYDRLQYVFGATGAAVLFRRDFIQDVSVEGEFFDEDFFAFREDADLAWRAQVMAWKCLYTPTAVAWHVRRVTPERRKDLPLLINWHSVKNRFLMRGKNASGWLCRRLFLPVAWRDMMTIGYALLRDQRMLSALAYPWRVRQSIRRKRAIIQSHRKVSDQELLWWFWNNPRAIDAQ